MKAMLHRPWLEHRVVIATPQSTRNPVYEVISRIIEEQFFVSWVTDVEVLAESANESSWPHNLLLLHQLEPHLRRAFESGPGTDPAANFIAAIDVLRSAGWRTVFVWHNQESHDSSLRELTREVECALFDRVDGAVTFGYSACEILRSKYKGLRVQRIGLPSLANEHGPRLPKSIARKSLGLDDGATIFAVIGDVKPYKNIQFILDAFIDFQVRRASTSQLLVIGAGADLLSGLFARGITVKDQPLSRTDYGTWMCAADFAVFAGTTAWISGGLVTALDYGVPVIAPDSGATSEYVLDGDNGYLYRPGNVSSLSQTFELAHDCLWPEHLRFKALVGLDSEHAGGQGLQQFLMDVYAGQSAAQA